MSIYKPIYNKFTGKLTLVRNDSAFHMKDPVDTYNDLPLIGNTENQVRIAKDTDLMYTWSISATSGLLTNWTPIGSSASIDWSAIDNKPSSTVQNIDDAVSKKHTQDTDQKLDEGGANEVTVAEVKSAVDDDHTHANKSDLDNVSGTNTGDETTTTLGSKINDADVKTTPVDADMIGLMNSAVSNILTKLSWANIKATLKTYFDSLYAVVLGADDNYVTDAEKVVIGNTSETNTGDETTETLGSKIKEADIKVTPVDADMVGLMNSELTDANTILLLHLDGVEGATSTIDSSNNAHDITFVGDAHLDTTIKKFGTASLALDGNGGYLSVSPYTDEDFSLVDGESWTVDFQLYLNSYNNLDMCFRRGQDASPWTGYCCIFDYNNYLRLCSNATGSGGIGMSELLPTGVKLHVEICHDDVADTLKIYINGVVKAVTTGSGIDWGNYTSPLIIGGQPNMDTRSLDGNIDEFRFSKGIARHTSDFTPPIVAYGTVSNLLTKLSWTNLKATLKTYLDTLYPSKIPNSGTTLNRPTTGLVAGYEYFDTTLGYQIWYNGTNWVDSEGALVDFVFTITTASPAVSLTLPLTNIGTFNCIVNWGDGNYSDITSYNDADRIHEYADAGNYTVSISGSCPAFDFRTVTTSRLLPTTILSWGDVKLQTVSFNNCTNLTTLPSMGDLSSLTTLQWAFQSCSSLTTLHAETFKNCNSVTFASDLFNGCTSLVTIPAGLFDDFTSAIHMSSCFRTCTSLTTIPAGLFNHCTSAQYFSESFRYCSSLTTIGSGTFDNCSAVTSFNLAFGVCTSLTAIPAGLFDDCASVTSFDSTFVGCSSVNKIPDELFKFCNLVTDFDSVFESTAITSIPENLFKNCSANTIIRFHFRHCTSLTSIPENLYSYMTEVTLVHSPFHNCTSLTAIPAGLFSGLTKVTAFVGVFDSCTTLTTIPSGLLDDMTLLTDASWNFQSCTGITTVPSDLFDNCTVVTGMIGCFKGCSGITSAVPVMWSRGSGYSVVTANVLNYQGCTSASNYASIPATWK